MLTEVLERPDAWVNAGKDRLLRPLTAEEIDVLERLVAGSRHISMYEVKRPDFDHPTVRALAAEIKHKWLREGPGAVVVSGLTQQRFSPEDFERVYWGIGTHLGAPAIQNYLGDLMTRVEKEENDGKPRDTRTKGRGYRNADEAGYHTDTNEIVGLMCVERGEKGGESVITSAVAIHNDFVRNRPELLKALYDGYFSAIGQDEVMTDEPGGIFAYHQGQLSVYAQFRTMRLAAEKRGEPLPADLAAAMDYFMERAIANEAEFLLEPGDMLLWNNRTILHGRRAFENSPTRKRLLLRLWLKPEDPLPLPANFLEFAKQRVRQNDADAYRKNALPA